MRDFMVDIECLGNEPGCAPFAIGAVGFDRDQGILGSTFYELINVASATAVGLSADYTWWNKQSPEAKSALLAAEATQQTLTECFHKFGVWMISNFGEDCRIWGNGASFDQPILTVAYSKAKIRKPWQFWNEMCYRTIKNLNPRFRFTRMGIYHNALDDSISQAVHLLEIAGHSRDHILASLPQSVAAEDEDLIG